MILQKREENYTITEAPIATDLSQHRIQKRRHHLDYCDAIRQELAIGSKELVQNRHILHTAQKPRGLVAIEKAEKMK